MKRAVLLLFLVFAVFEGHAQVKKTFTLTQAVLVSNESVGNEWSYSVQIISKDQVQEIPLQFPVELSVPDGTIITVKAKVVEDEKSPDIGYGQESVQIHFDTTEMVEFYVTVKEDRGRFSGNTALWHFIVMIE